MRYYAMVAGKPEPIAVEVAQLPGGQFAFKIGGRSFTVDALLLDGGAASLLIDGNSYPIELEAKENGWQVQVRNQVIHVEVADERQLGLQAARSGVSMTGPQVITAPMPGKVVRFLTRVGDQVEAGQSLVVIEAMKMENELKSPKAGTVVSLLAEEGSTVEHNAKLVIVD